MGCKTVSKGKAASLTLADIQLKNTGIHSLDAFFATCTNILADISGIIGHLFDFKINFLKKCGFDTIPGSGKLYFLFKLILCSSETCLYGIHICSSG